MQQQQTKKKYGYNNIHNVTHPFKEKSAYKRFSVMSAAAFMNAGPYGLLYILIANTMFGANLCCIRFARLALARLDSNGAGFFF